ncbi:condensation domain-containing protein [Actinophytocola sediminis]
MKIVFTGERSLVAPLTWGQRQVMRQRSALNLGRVLDTPPVLVPLAVDAITALVGRHEALRTRLIGPDRPEDLPADLADGVAELVRQQVASTGGISLDVVHCGVDETATAVAQARTRLVVPPFNHVEEWPLRVAVVVAADIVRHIVLACSPLAVDDHGMELVVKDLRLLLRGALPVRSAAQPVDDAERQRTDGGELTERAIRHWRTELRRATLVTAPPGEPAAATLRSTTLANAAHVVAQRHGVRPSTVYLAAAAKVIGTLTDQHLVAMRTVVSNRFRPDCRDVVGAIAQDGLVVLNLAVPSFGDLVDQTWRTVVRAHRFARYDPDKLAKAVPGRPFASIDVRPLGHREPPPAGPRPVGGCQLTVGRSEVSLHADTPLVPVEDSLRALENLLFSAAYQVKPESVGPGA